jgi:hypothetical protein
MPEEYEVHGPHDHAVEHVTEHGSGRDPMAGRMAVMTAIMATIGALFSFQSGTTENLALYHKNEAAIRKTQAANQWDYYQAKGQKENLAELGAALTTSDAAAHARFAADIDKYISQKAPIRAQAELLEKSVLAADQESEALLHQHHRWAQATTLVQISISLAAITLLTRRRWMQIAAYCTALGGVLVGALAVLHV